MSGLQGRAIGRTWGLAVFSAAVVGTGVLSSAVARTTRPAVPPARVHADDHDDHDDGAATTRALLEQLRPSVVAVEYTYTGEVVRRVLVAAGVVVRPDGMVAFTINFTPEGLPVSQLRDFKIILPPDEGHPEERKIDATYLGRDERSELGFVLASPSGGQNDSVPADGWRAVSLADDDAMADVGQTVWSVGRLGEAAGYSAYVTKSMVSAGLRGPVPQTLVSGGGLAGVGSVVVNASGEVVGMTHFQPNFSPLLNTPGDGTGGAGEPLPTLYVPTSYLRIGVEDPPPADGPQRLPDLGIRQASGLSRELSEYYGLVGRPAVEVSDVVPGFAADRAGVRNGDVIVTLNGESLERGDMPDELPLILGRTIRRMNPGDLVTLGVVREPDGEPIPIEVTLGERPPQPNRAERFFAEDLGFSTREAVFDDLYQRRLPPESQGVVVAFIRSGGSAETSGLEGGDFVTRLNESPIAGLADFRENYQAFRRANPREPVIFEVTRGAGTQVVRVEPPG